MSKRAGVLTMMVLCVAAFGCGSSGDDAAATAVEDVRRATAYINAKSGAECYGSAIFIREPAGVTVQVSIENAAPGTHAVHIHEKGDCSSDDGTSAGGHWNPTTEEHGAWGTPPHHLGDIGNLEVGDDGTGSITLTTDRWTMGSGETNDIMGKAVIVHADADDFTSQPTGAAGGRIGCGVINAG